MKVRASTSTPSVIHLDAQILFVPVWTAADLNQVQKKKYVPFEEKDGISDEERAEQVSHIDL